MTTDKNEVKDLAYIFIEEVQTALVNGTKHYRKSNGNLLGTFEDIIHAIVEEGEITIEPKRVS